MLIEKSRSGVYQDTPENRRLHRVGQRYGEAKKPEEKKTGLDKITPNSSRKEFKKYLSGKNGGDYYRAVAEAYDAYKRGGGRDPLSLMLADVGSDTPSKDVPAGKYVEAVAAGASHDEAVKFADDSYKKLRAKIDEIHKKDNDGGYTSTEIANMWSDLRNWFKAQKFEKKAASGSGVKKDETKLPTKLGDLEFNEDKPTGERWYEGEMGGQRVRILQETVGKDDWWVVEISGHNVVDDNNKAMKFDNVQDALEEVKQEIEPVKGNNEKQDKPTSRVTFADVPRSREVNLKKYLTDSRRKDVDRLMQTVDGMSSGAIKQAHDAAVKKFNDNFDNMKKSERASALYVIMKYKDLMNKSTGK